MVTFEPLPLNTKCCSGDDALQVVTAVSAAVRGGRTLTTVRQPSTWCGSVGEISCTQCDSPDPGDPGGFSSCHVELISLSAG